MENSNRLFISFLGTNSYVPCNYFLEEKQERKIHNVAYIQEALLRILAQEDLAPGRVRIFLTEDAKNKNWEPVDHEGLAARLELLQQEGLLQEGIVATPAIPTGLTSDDVWEIFRKVFEEIRPGDEVYLDITHAFRSIPMLGMSILNYAKALKNVQLKAIYYGAFEALGNGQQVRDMPMEERNAAVLNLVQLSDIQNWAVSANLFIEHGNAKPLRTVAKQQLKPILQQREPDHVQQQAARSLNTLTKYLEELTEAIQTNRGRQIVRANVFKKLHENLAENHSGLIPLLDPVIDKLREKIESFDIQENALNGIEAVQWCINHGLIQQGMTMLQETVITFLCLQAGLSYTDAKAREIVSAALWIVSKNKQAEMMEWNNTAIKNEAVTRLVVSKIPPGLTACFDSLTDSRNDINHAGFSKDNKAADLKKKLISSFEKIEDIIRNYDAAAFGAEPPPPAQRGKIFLNLTNHPSAQWQPAQREAAAALGEVVDWPFPAVEAGASEDDIEQLAKQLAEKIMAMHQQAAVSVHLMGEMTLSFRLLQMLLKVGIPCLASTSRREVVEEGNGQKTVRFHFERFRYYAPPPARG